MAEPVKNVETKTPPTAWADEMAPIMELDISHIQTDDQAPVDSLFTERQQRLLVEPLYVSWKPSQPFLACDNVAIFYGLYLPPVVPDMFLSLGVEPPQGALIHEKRRRSYFVWEYSKPPDVVVEVLSPSYGGEFDEKMRLYAQIGVGYYVVYDPADFRTTKRLTCYELQGRRYEEVLSGKLEGVGLEVRLWRGVFEGIEAEWLRWYDASGNLLLTGAELAEKERQRAEQAEARAERLAAELRKLGIDPDRI
ncbi:MAG: Uma2 family endonuclease [Chloroherpetonaceae bacterium]|nr:Uma2 family endonuclease [Chloroherpetonaceae bacterium]MCS7211042.1 Uma2 family endonuclease [Chloroherpetonaceae bacterium]MDW8019466.1 Uma2 family endonuclease [Chloroherpetonaceae bacterium]MDW8464700.1 Uma2 family endonuclease [Chloroherpetonaceae bacterium]